MNAIACSSWTDAIQQKIAVYPIENINPVHAIVKKSVLGIANETLQVDELPNQE